MIRALLLTLILTAIAQPALAIKMVGPEQQKRACTLSGGQWVDMPDWCAMTNPDKWKALDVKQRSYCMKVGRTPCFCPKGKSFQIGAKLIGCQPDPFYEIDQRKKLEKKEREKVDYKKLFDDYQKQSSGR
jgi:hypothetical protein